MADKEEKTKIVAAVDARMDMDIVRKLEQYEAAMVKTAAAIERMKKATGELNDVEKANLALLQKESEATAGQMARAQQKLAQLRQAGIQGLIDLQDPQSPFSRSIPEGGHDQALRMLKTNLGAVGRAGIISERMIGIGAGGTGGQRSAAKDAIADDAQKEATERALDVTKRHERTARYLQGLRSRSLGLDQRQRDKATKDSERTAANRAKYLQGLRSRSLGAEQRVRDKEVREEQLADGKRNRPLSFAFRAMFPRIGRVLGLGRSHDGGDGSGYEGGLAIAAGVAGITAAAIATAKMLSFARESVQYWNQIGKSALTVGTAMGFTTADMESSRHGMLTQGMGLGFKADERMMMTVGAMRGGFNMAAGGDFATLARALRIDPGAEAAFAAGLGPLLGGRGRLGGGIAGGIYGAAYDSGMGHDPQAFQAAFQGMLQMRAQKVGVANTPAAQQEALRFATGIERTDSGQGAMGVGFAQKIGDMTSQGPGQLMLMEALRREHPSWDYLQIKDAMADPTSIENVRLMQAQVKMMSGGNQRVQDVMLDSLGLNKQERPDYMSLDFKAKMGPPRSAMMGNVARAMGDTPEGLKARAEELKSNAEYGLGAALGTPLVTLEKNLWGAVDGVTGFTDETGKARTSMEKLRNFVDLVVDSVSGGRVTGVQHD